MTEKLPASFEAQGTEAFRRARDAAIHSDYLHHPAKGGFLARFRPGPTPARGSQYTKEQRQIANIQGATQRALSITEDYNPSFLLSDVCVLDPKVALAPPVRASLRVYIPEGERKFTDPLFQELIGAKSDNPLEPRDTIRFAGVFAPSAYDAPDDSAVSTGVYFASDKEPYVRQLSLSAAELRFSISTQALHRLRILTHAVEFGADLMRANENAFVQEHAVHSS